MNTHRPYYSSKDYWPRFLTGPPADPKKLAKWRQEYLYEPYKAREEEDYRDILDYMIAVYDGSILYSNDMFQQLLESIEEISPPERTLIIFVSDHGEEFYEHNGTTHGRTVFEEVIRVPLIMA